MALVLKKLVESYQFYMEKYSDRRTNDLPLMSSGLNLIALMAAYLYFVFAIGPWFMKNRRPFKIEKILQVYNMFQVVACGYVFARFLYLIWGTYDWRCQGVDYSDDPVAVEIAHLVYIYFWLKITDLFDTVFFILRKNYRQVTFLHVYHHCGMLLVGWIGTKFLAGGSSSNLVIVNSFVHMVMYFYYFLTSYDETLKKNLWWKKYLTQIQLVQFAYLIITFSSVLFMPECGYPQFTSYLLVPQNTFIIVLFGDFYYKSYVRPKMPKKTPVVTDVTQPPQLGSIFNLKKQL